MISRKLPTAYNSTPVAPLLGASWATGFVRGRRRRPGIGALDTLAGNRVLREKRRQAAPRSLGVPSTRLEHAPLACAGCPALTFRGGLGAPLPGCLFRTS